MSSIEQAIDNGHPICVVVRLTGEAAIQRTIELHMLKSASMVNIDQRLNLQNHQVPEIAKMLLQTFPNESVEDFVIAFNRGALGLYGQLFRVDGAVIMDWVRKYLEEKYQIIETRLMKEKEKMYEFQKQDFDLDKLIEDWKQKIGYVESESDNSKRNAYERERLTYIQSAEEREKNLREKEIHHQWIRENFHPDGKRKETWRPEKEWRESYFEKLAHDLEKD